MSSRKSTTRSAGGDGKPGSFTAEERAAMKERARELNAAARRNATRADGERDLLEKIAQLEPPERDLAARLHALIMSAAPDLAPRTWYGMPAWARDGKVLCFFQGAAKFGTRYATLGFSDQAALDDGAMWPTSFAITALGEAESARIAGLVRRAVG
jgi:uncharacterized protein YdhG (YjbR/CyaY superfamily)